MWKVSQRNLLGGKDLSTGEVKRLWRKDNPEKEKQYNVNAKERKHQWYLDNIELTKKRSKQWANDNFERRKEISNIHTKKRCRLGRKMLGEKLGYQLRYEQKVHHIDMNDFNNDLKNLHVYENQSEHMLGHGSLNKLVAQLLAKKIIEFQNGKYVLKEGGGA